MLSRLLSWLWPSPAGLQRSSQWRRVREQHLERWKWCAACGKTTDLEVHHVIPVSVDPSQECTADNLITLCRSSCHLLLGHLGDWTSYNVDVRSDCSRLLEKVRKRP